MDRPPLTPADVHDVVFDKAPLGKRGYDEKQVDDFLDRIEGTLSGRDTLAADDVRSVVFDASPLIKRGYHEDQVDDFLDAVVATLERRERTITTPPVAHPWPTEQTTPMPFAQPPSLPADDPHPVTEPLRDRDLSEPDDWDAAHAGPDDLLALPLPPPPPGSRGYRPGDVEKLAKLLAAAIEQVDGPSANDLARFKLTRTFFTGQGYHTGVVDVLIHAWLDELRNRED